MPSTTTSRAGLIAPILLGLAVSAGIGFGQPAELLSRAKELLLQPTGRPEAEALLRQAVDQFEKQPVKTDAYAEALLVLGMTLNPGLAGNKEALATQVEPLARKAMELRQRNPDVTSGDLALALEFEALVLEEMGRVEESREPKAKARALRDQIIIAMQGATGQVVMNPLHMGPGVQNPQLMARSEPEYTFAARVLKMQTDVIAELVIGTDGLVHQIEIYRPAGFGLDESAVAALMKWRFKPAAQNGIPVAVEGTLRLRFH